MLFNSFSFLAFFAILVAVYYLLPHKFRWVLLVVASLFFYSTFSLGYVLLLLGSALVAYLAGLAIGAAQEKKSRRSILVLGGIASLAPLFVFKYFDFFISSFDTLWRISSLRLGLVLPVGLSFYSFSCVSYLIDIYRSRLAPERHFGRLLLYVSFFPKLLAGPIERATAFLPQLLQSVRFDPK